MTTTKGNEMRENMMTRSEAIAIVGENAVLAVEAENCEPSNRVGYNGACQGDEFTEWRASAKCVDAEGAPAKLVAYYYTTNDQDQIMADAGGDGAAIDWTIAGYEVI